ncbi:uncharacterized protein ASCRUDRAFT_73192 [Ascoidea rubescens DSM 1968]|uniref:Uncharacterized protein n=1 Tax=Ascoidea rubescens DSM 1968 TaxID=1344418 RepID=A0A1D2VNV7_9ASCO|nr:hypothetical protein ASCRUDRAFT_73192 [Ascoidea rubescens DSM 1968]ODV63301.1 hypothetical protein ASCRUDRAFT_73192 [Ascoidea rubescens DSM 1968]
MNISAPILDTSSALSNTLIRQYKITKHLSNEKILLLNQFMSSTTKIRNININQETNHPTIFLWRQDIIDLSKELKLPTDSFLNETYQPVNPIELFNFKIFQQKILSSINNNNYPYSFQHLHPAFIYKIISKKFINNYIYDNESTLYQILSTFNISHYQIHDYSDIVNIFDTLDAIFNQFQIQRNFMLTNDEKILIYLKKILINTNNKNLLDVYQKFIKKYNIIKNFNRSPDNNNNNNDNNNPTINNNNNNNNNINNNNQFLYINLRHILIEKLCKLNPHVTIPQSNSSHHERKFSFTTKFFRNKRSL